MVPAAERSEGSVAVVERSCGSAPLPFRRPRPGVQSHETICCSGLSFD